MVENNAIHQRTMAENRGIISLRFNQDQGNVSFSLLTLKNFQGSYLQQSITYKSQ